MKKIIAVLLLCAIAVSLSACHSKKNMTDEEYSEYLVAEESKRVAESIKSAEEISQAVQEVSDDLGKTVKDKKLVIFRDEGDTKYYRVYMMDDDAKTEYMVTYYFASTSDGYKALVDSGKSDGDLYKKDADTRMVAFKSKSVKDVSFAELYDGYSQNDSWTVVE